LAFSPFTSAAAKIEHWQTPQGSGVYYVHTEGLPMVIYRLFLMPVVRAMGSSLA